MREEWNWKPFAARYQPPNLSWIEREPLMKALNENPRTREELEQAHGPTSVWSTEDVRRGLTGVAFMAPYMRGYSFYHGCDLTFYFQHEPRLYWIADLPPIRRGEEWCNARSGRVIRILGCGPGGWWEKAGKEKDRLFSIEESSFHLRPLRGSAPGSVTELRLRENFFPLKWKYPQRDEFYPWA